jgi:hypothetical protein
MLRVERSNGSADPAASHATLSSELARASLPPRAVRNASCSQNGQVEVGYPWANSGTASKPTGWAASQAQRTLYGVTHLLLPTGHSQNAACSQNGQVKLGYSWANSGTASKPKSGRQQNTRRTLRVHTYLGLRVQLSRNASCAQIGQMKLDHSWANSGTASSQWDRTTKRTLVWLTKHVPCVACY